MLESRREPLGEGRHGPSVLFVTSGWPTPENPTSIFVAEQAAQLSQAGVDVEVVAFSGRMNPANYARARFEYRRKLASDRFDIVHAHFGQTGLIVFPTQKLVVLTLYGSDVLGVVGRSGRYTLRGRVLRRISAWAAGRAAHVVVVSNNLASRMRRYVPCEVLPLGVDRSVFAPEPKQDARLALGWEQRRRYVLFAGQPYAPAKRFDLARAAVRALPPNVEARLIIVTGQPREVVAKHLNAADALLMTSKHEASPVIVKEAIACNLPVVSVDVGDVREVIGEIPGCVVCVDDRPSTISRGLVAVLSEARRIYGQEVAARFDQRVLAERQAQIYRDVISRRG